MINEETMKRSIIVIIQNGCAEREWSMTEFCDRVKVSRPNFYRYLRGERHYPFPLLVRIALVFGMKPSELIQQAEEYSMGYWG